MPSVQQQNSPGGSSTGSHRLVKRLLSGAFIVSACILAVFLGRKRHAAAMDLSGLEPRSLGNPAATVVLTEYSDFQCPNCRWARPYLEALMKRYGGQVRFVYRYFPLNVHDKSWQAAIAAECAARQGKFWAFHDQMFDHQPDWAGLPLADAAKLWEGYAKDAGVDVPRWTQCQSDPSAKKAVDRDVAEGDAWDVDSTPTLFIGPRRLVGALQIQTFAAGIIEDELKSR